jgi:hypothetical protein
MSCSGATSIWIPSPQWFAYAIFLFMILGRINQKPLRCYVQSCMKWNGQVFKWVDQDFVQSERASFVCPFSQNDLELLCVLEQIGSRDRSEGIWTSNFPQGGVTDHRLGITHHAINDVDAGRESGCLHWCFSSTAGNGSFHRPLYVARNM